MKFLSQKTLKKSPHIIVDGKPVYFKSKKNLPNMNILRDTYSKINDDRKIPVVFETKKQYLQEYIKNQEAMKHYKFPQQQKQKYIHTELKDMSGVVSRYTTRKNKYIEPRVVLFTDKKLPPRQVALDIYHEYGHEVWEKSPKLRKTWSSHISPKTSPTPYGRTDKEEDFADSFAYKKAGLQIDQSRSRIIEDKCGKSMVWNVEQAKAEGNTIQYMSPQDYLNKTTKPFNTETYWDTEKKKSLPISELTKHIQSPTTRVTIPFVGNDPSDHEGRRRALAAQYGGEKRIPVSVPVPQERREQLGKKFASTIYPNRPNREDWQREVDEHDRKKWENRITKNDFPEHLMDSENTKIYRELKEKEGLQFINQDNQSNERKYYHGTSTISSVPIMKEGLKPSKQLPKQFMMSDKTNPNYTYAFEQPHHAGTWAKVVSQRTGFPPKVLEVEVPEEKTSPDYEMPFGKSVKIEGSIPPQDIKEYKGSLEYPEEDKNNRLPQIDRIIKGVEQNKIDVDKVTFNRIYRNLYK